MMVMMIGGRQFVDAARGAKNFVDEAQIRQQGEGAVDGIEGNIGLRPAHGV